MNLMTITTKNPKTKKYNISVDLSTLEKIAGAFGLFRTGFINDVKESLRDMRAGRIVKAGSLKDL